MPPYIMSACSRMFVFLSDHFRNVFKKYENMAVVTMLIKAGKEGNCFFLEDSSDYPVEMISNLRSSIDLLSR